MRLTVQCTRREDKVKVRLQTFPIHLPQAGHLGAERLGIATEGQRIAQLDLEPPGNTLIHRHFAGLRRPTARQQRIVRRQIRQPGQVQFAIHRFTARIVLVHPFGRHLLVNLGQANTDNRIVGLRCNLMLLQESLHLRHLRFGQVQQEVVWAVRRQLLLPALEQIATQHQQ
ncbi:hypothetical protein D3C71_1247340 [compost metagenome]